MSEKFRLRGIPFHDVRIDDSFWSRRQRVNREVSLPKQYKMCEESGRIDALRLLGPPKGPTPHIYWDSDTAKWLEAACYACRIDPDDGLRRQIDHVADLFRRAQQPDGYLNSYFTVLRKERRWKNLRANHELYCAGHFFEAAVAHHQLTGNDDLLSTACRYADYIATVFGHGEGQIPGYCGCEEIELALIRVYHATGTRRYLELASYFVEERGRQPCYFERERAEYPADLFAWDAPLRYFQAHAPVREQTEVVGHAVRAMYLYCALADLAGETGDASLRETCERLWQDLTRSKLYLTGGIGSHWEHESFSEPYFLPNERAYCETCATVSLIFWSHRMLKLTGAHAHAEVMERCLYNALLAGVSLDGESFFYENPLASLGQRHRQSWFVCACCPSNLSRLLASLGGYIYAEADDELRVQLYIGSEARFRHGVVRQSGGMPWQGDVRLQFDLENERADFTLVLRLPSWANGYELRINGEKAAAEIHDGWLRLHQSWKRGDVVELSLPMEIRRVAADPRVLADAGQTALQRGPFVYCVEDADFEAGALNVRLPGDAKLVERTDTKSFSEEIVVLDGAARRRLPPENESLYFSQRSIREAPTPFRAVPYFTWDNRRPGAMRVWIPET